MNGDDSDDCIGNDDTDDYDCYATDADCDKNGDMGTLKNRNMQIYTYVPHRLKPKMFKTL